MECNVRTIATQSDVRIESTQYSVTAQQDDTKIDFPLFLSWQRDNDDKIAIEEKVI